MMNDSIVVDLDVFNRIGLRVPVRRAPRHSALIGELSAPFGIEDRAVDDERSRRGPGRRGPRRRGEDGRGGGFAERLFPVDAFRRDHSASLR